MIPMRRITLLVLLLLLAAVASPAPRGLAQSRQAAQPDVSVRADFDNDGFSDLAVGAPTESLGTSSQAGAVTVLYATASGLTGSGSQLFTQDTPGVPGAVEPGDQFGAALATGDFNHDGVADLAAGASLEDADTTRDAGAVTVLYGSASGLTTRGSQLFTQVAGAVEQGDRFGSALATGDLDRDGFADLVAGAPLEDAGTAVDAGAVSVLYGSAGGLTTSGGQLFIQVAGAVEQGDRFGAALATGDFNNNGFADLAVGAPLEDAGTTRDAGAVSVLYGSGGGLTASGARTFTQVAGAAEQGDRFGAALATGDFNVDGFADLGAGAPLEDVGLTADAGAVSEIRGSASGLTTSGGRIHTKLSFGGLQSGDQFGVALASGVFDNSGVTDLAVGVPGQNSWDGLPDVGAVLIFDGTSAGLEFASGQVFTFLGASAPAKRGDRFASALVTGDFDSMGQDDIAAGAPLGDVGSTVDAGRVGVVYDFFADEFHNEGYDQNTPGVAGGAEAGDHFGAALAAR
jgi:hypothetical protein